MSGECCGKERKTNYCPDCGKAVTEPSALKNLRDHIKKLWDETKARVSKLKKATEEEKAAKAYKKTLASNQTLAAKYGEWMKALDEVLAPPPDPEPSLPAPALVLPAVVELAGGDPASVSSLPHAEDSVSVGEVS